MGVSTDGQICFGVKFEEGFEFPWDAEHDGDIEKWWQAVAGYKPPFELYDERGEYLNGKEPTKKQSEEYYDHRRKWDEANPIPVELVNYCSGDCPMYIVAVKSSLISNSRGYPEGFDPANLKVSADDVHGLEDFIKTHLNLADLEVKPEPRWYLSSYWG